MEEKIFGYCTACGSYVYRIVGKLHGDGQQDSENNQIWLLEDVEFMNDDEIEEANLNEINCGCNE